MQRGRQRNDDAPRAPSIETACNRLARSADVRGSGLMEVGPRVRDSNRRWRPFEAAPVMTTVRVVAAVVASLLACGPAAVAGPPTAEEEAAVLFEHAKALMDASRYAEACPTFERSETLDPQVGPMLNLAFCDENLGKTATAWTVWVEAAAKADERGQT